MPPALRKGPVSPARAAAVLASPSGSLTAHQLFGTPMSKPTPGACLDWAVTR